MTARIVSIAVGALMTVSPALAQQSNTAKPAIPQTAQHGAGTKKPETKQAAAGPKVSHGAELPAALAAVPEAERRAIQADLVWLGHYESMSAEEVDGHTADAIKAFQKRNNGKETGVLSESERSLLAQAVKAPQAAVGWRLIDDTASGARFGLPEKLVPRTETSRAGSRWTSAGGQIQVETFRWREASLPALFEQEKKTARRQAVKYSALGPDSFAIIGEQRLKKFIVRAQASGSEVRGVTILYDQATEGTMAPIAISMSDTFVGFPDQAAAALPGRVRGVEYGSAVVVTSRGDLLAPGQVTDGCQSITVPGFGHADRIAEDKTNDLALLRLYGARNLVPASLGGDGDNGGSAPRCSASPTRWRKPRRRHRATSAAAQLTAQGLDPAPKLGFSGAAAIDAQGRFAGIVALKGASHSRTGPVTQQATLVPADDGARFLPGAGHRTSRGPILPADPAAIERQSIVRVICACVNSYRARTWRAAFERMPPCLPSDRRWQTANERDAPLPKFTPSASVTSRTRN